MNEQQRGSVRVEPGRKWVRAYAGGELVFDTRAPRLVWEHPHFPAYYIPREDVRVKLAESDQVKRSPSRGNGRYFHVRAGGGTLENAALIYSDSPIEELRGLVRFEWDAMDEWLEEDEPIYTHPRDPYSRVDILASSRKVRIEVDGTTVAESDQPKILFETGLPPRYYLPLTDIRQEFLRPSSKQSHCPYKGMASYWSVEVAGKVHEDLVWIYRAPFPESQKIAGLAAFFDEKVDVYVDGELQERPRTAFS